MNRTEVMPAAVERELTPEVDRERTSQRSGRKSTDVGLTLTGRHEKLQKVFIKLYSSGSDTSTYWLYLVVCHEFNGRVREDTE